MTHLRTRTIFLQISMLVAIAAMLVAPTSASAIMAGAESNRELVNSNVTPAERDAALAKMQAQGVQVVRANFGWNEVALGGCNGQTPKQLANHLNPCYSWSALDDLVKSVQDHKMQLLISITRVPQWVIGSSDVANMGATQAQFDKVLANYVAFHQAAGTRYKAGSPYGTIKYWTIHNEPNSVIFWKPAPNAQRYAMLYAKTAVALKAVNPTAQVAPGPTGPKSTIKPITFIKAFQTYALKYLPGSLATKRKYIDAWAHNPYPGYNSQPSVASGPTPSTLVTMATIDRLVKQLDASPLTKGKSIWATEFGWETSGGTFITTPARQAQFLAEAFDWLDSKKRFAIGIQYGLTDPQNPEDWQSGTFYLNGTAKPAFAMYQRMISVPQGGLNYRVKRGTTVNVWGRSNLVPPKGQLAYMLPGKKCKPGFQWCLVPGQKRAKDGSIRAKFKINAPKIVFATYDAGGGVNGVAAGYGPGRTITTF